MRLTKLSMAALALALAAGFAFAQKVGDSMQPRKANTQIYANEVRGTYEAPVASVGQSDILTVTEVRKNHLKVSTASGAEGFVQRSDLSKASNAAIAKSRAYTFGAMEVQGYNDVPTSIYIIDETDPNADPISLDRSFKEALKVNVDRETMERAL